MENVLKIYGDQGTIDLTRWQTTAYSRAGALNPREAPKEDTLVTPVDGRLPPQAVLGPAFMPGRAATG